MKISLNDKSLITSYIQMFLRDYFGISVKSPSNNTRKFVDDWYEISSTPIKVTGIYDLSTYSSASLFMAINYPKEQFPCKYDIEDGDKVVLTYFDSEKLKRTIDWIKTWYVRKIDEKTYVGNNPDLSKVFDWYTFLKYFYSIDRLESILDSESWTFNQVLRESALTFIVNNMELSYEYQESVSLPERVISYFFNEVVTPSSTRDEIYRIQKKIYKNLDRQFYGIFTEDMTNKISLIQKRFINVHTVENDQGVQVSFPEGFEGFKVTGYVDPWTEMIIDGGIR